MNWLLASIHAHQVTWALGTFWTVSAAIGAMPTPQSQTGFYRWLFDFSHVLAANIARVVATRYPQAQLVQNGTPVTPKQ